MRDRVALLTTGSRPHPPVPARTLLPFPRVPLGPRP